ncbi:hypothetical protein L905_07055 [Agrobacterium sp. TS43]|uniref:alpha/beta hydrolase n=1 Tax=Agrobacterium TaxID=357 RepID=UPI00037C6C43|nr:MULTISPECIES: alpha/beta hydrolase [Agrobacterium]EPR21247.1 hypothetical protein L902_01895 [Agrobacterium radiobacter DSM 30147]KVK49906.1 hypothetical protein L903_18710 [Agrobacterium sp. JL28]KVK50197.1 hypothetical protein L904_18705 [Agrobacterium sp. LY4]KVK54265.1 hypothetical protein L901_18010 [Agrobacterium sp. D14]KVK59240.1 hypothetical protein L905_07055 [Agrobacterium sp. TS43]
MQLHPKIAEALLAAKGSTPLHELPVEEVRRLSRLAYETGAPKLTLHSVLDQILDLDRSPVPVRVYRPTDKTGLPVTVFFHGSGFCILDIDTHDAFCRFLATRTQSIVVSVDYALAPEARFPAGLNDCVDATRWVQQHAISLGGDANKLVLVGDSAGACLALLSALRLNDSNRRVVSALMLLFPVADHYSSQRASYEHFATGFGLTAKMMRWFWDHYIDSEATEAIAAAAPLRAPTFSALPPSYIQLAGFDVLFDEGRALAAKLVADGVPTELDVAGDMNHGFIRWLGLIKEVDAHLERACSWLERRFYTR